MGSDGVEDLPVAFGFCGEDVAVGDVVAVEVGMRPAQSTPTPPTEAPRVRLSRRSSRTCPVGDDEQLDDLGSDWSVIGTLVRLHLRRIRTIGYWSRAARSRNRV